MKIFLPFLLLLISQAVLSQTTTVIDPVTKDTTVTTKVTVQKSFSYPETTTTITIKRYRATITPTPTTGYLALPISGIKDVSGQSNIIIENLRFENTSAASIKVWNAKNITIRNCFFNKSAKEAIDMQNSSNITITNCLFNKVETGVYALNCQTIKINNNQFINVRRRPGEGRGQFVQFNGGGGPGCEIMNNKGENFQGESDPEDMISLFSASGTSTSPILIKNNTFRGGGPSNSGGGIIAGDHGGSWVIIENNSLLNPGQYGMAVAGGSNIQILYNKIFSKQFAWSNNPLYVWSQEGGDPCSNITVKGNRATWTDKNGAINGGWNAGNCSNTVFEYPTPITEAEMNFPAHLIDFISPSELLTIRGK